MKKIILSLALALGLVGGAAAAGGGIPWDKFPEDKLSDQAALQNGAKLFVNHCLNCHSASYMRYNRLRDIGLTEEQIKGSLMFTTDKVGDTMKAALSAKDGKDWFGGTPPDLTLVARSRAAVGQGTGPDYLYTLLRKFYRDDSKATGWNNLAYPNIGMPHVLWDLQGPRELVVTEIRPARSANAAANGQAGWEEVRTVHAADGSTSATAKPLPEYHGHGSLGYVFNATDAARSARYDAEVADLVAFLAWMGEPAAASRVKVGVWVLIFLGVFTVFAWRLNAAYWKDVK